MRAAVSLNETFSRDVLTCKHPRWVRAAVAAKQVDRPFADPLPIFLETLFFFTDANGLACNHNFQQSVRLRCIHRDWPLLLSLSLSLWFLLTPSCSEGASLCFDISARSKNSLHLYYDISDHNFWIYEIFRTFRNLPAIFGKLTRKTMIEQYYKVKPL